MDVIEKSQFENSLVERSEGEKQIVRQGIIFDFNRTLFNPENDSLENGAIGILNYLANRNWVIYIVALNEDERRSERIEKLGLKAFVKKIILIPKKTEEIFLSCASDAGVKPEDFVVVGDRIKSEIRIGNNLGMLTIWYKKGKFISEEPSNDGEEPNEIITDLAELKNIL